MIPRLLPALLLIPCLAGAEYRDIEALMSAACKRVAASEVRYAAIWVKE